MKKFLILFFAVVVLTGVGASTVFAEKITCVGYVTCVEFNSEVNPVNNETDVLLGQYIFHMETYVKEAVEEQIPDRNPDYSYKIYTALPEDSPFVKVLIPAYENRIKCEFYCERNDNQLCVILEEYYFDLLGVKTLEERNRIYSNEEIVAAIDVLGQKVKSLEDVVGVQTKNLNRMVATVGRIENNQNSQYITQNTLLNGIKGTVQQIRTNINTVISKLAEIKNLLVSSNRR